MNDDAIVSSIENLRSIFAIVLALALGEAFQQFVVDTLHKGPGGDGDKHWIRWDGLPALVAFLLLLIPFYHGNARYFSVEYRTSARPEPYGIYVLLDVFAFTCEATFFFVMARSIHRIHWRRFYASVVAILIIDSIWDSTVWLTHQHAFEPWLFLNLLFSIVFGAILFAERAPTSKWGPRLALIAMTIRTIADYGTSWELYFPPAKHKTAAVATPKSDLTGKAHADVKATIYLAAPQFTQGEWAWNAILASALRRQRFEVILPQERASAMITGKQKFDARQLFAENVQGLEQADVVLALLDGADADSGTCWEVGYAYQRGRPVVGLRTDVRTSSGDPKAALNVMLAQSCKDIVIVPLAKRDDVTWVSEQIASRVHAVHKSEKPARSK